MRLNSFTQAGGVNSIESFARSWQRAAGFVELARAPQSFLRSETGHTDEEHGVSRQKSPLGHQTETEGATINSDVDNETFQPFEAADGRGEAELQDDIFSKAPYIPTSISTSYGAIYEPLSSRVNDSSLQHAGRLYREQQLAGVQDPDQEREPLLVKQVEREDGSIVNVVVGQSTLPQTVFNSVNVLIGVGLLSLPLGMRYAGWLIGMLYLLFCAGVTSYTAGILAKCLDVDNSLVTFADLAYVSFGSRARIVTSLLFGLEITAACVALIILFSDSLDALIPGWGILQWKVACGVILIPLVFVPLRFLSFTSVLGILCCFGSEHGGVHLFLFVLTDA